MAGYLGEAFAPQPSIVGGKDINLEEVPVTDVLKYLYRYEVKGIKKMDTFRIVESYGLFKVIKNADGNKLSWVNDENGDSFITRVDAMRAIINNIKGAEV